MNPVFEKLADAERSATDTALWTAWDEGGRKPSAAKPILDRFRPMIADRARIYMDKGLMIPPAAIMAEHQKQFMRAMETYDPNRGASLGTHVFSTMRAASRFITTNQNVARITETRIFRIGDLKRATSVLDSRHNREPTTKELEGYLHWNAGAVMRLQKENRRDLRSSKFLTDTNVHQPSSVPSALKFVRKDLEPRDRKVLDALMQHKKIREIAKARGIGMGSPSAVAGASSESRSIWRRTCMDARALKAEAVEQEQAAAEVRDAAEAKASERAAQVQAEADAAALKVSMLELKARALQHSAEQTILYTELYLKTLRRQADDLVAEAKEALKRTRDAVEFKAWVLQYGTVKDKAAAMVKGAI